MYAIEEASTNNNSEINENTSNERVVNINQQFVT